MDKKNIQLAFSHMRLHKVMLFVNVAILMVASCFEGIGISMLIPILQSISNNENTNIFIKYSRSVFNYFHIDYNFVSLMSFFAIVVLMQFFLVGLQHYLARVVSATMTYELRKKAFQNLMRVALDFYYGVRSGDLVSTAWVSTNNAGGIIEYTIILLRCIIFATVYIVINCMISLPLTIVTLMIASLSYLFIIPRFKKVYDQGSEEKILTDDANSFLHDSLSGIKILKAFNNEGYHVKRYVNILKKYRNIQIQIMKNKIFASFMLEPFAFSIVIFIMIISVKIFNTPLPLLVVFLFVFVRIIPNIKLINGTYMQINELLPHFSKVQELIDKKDKIYLNNGTYLINTFESSIELSNVFYKYSSNEPYVLKDISFTIERNTIVAFVGASGGGKSTMVDLILRYHDPSKGIIKVDGMNLQSVNIESWHNLLAIVDQDPYLFNDSIYNNIAYGNFDANKEQVLQAAKMAYAHEFIINLPEGYNTVVGNRGIKLSGGQRQRISLARALVRDPEILILDEATSSLDSESEQLIQKSINALQKKKTILIIAHRLSTIQNADKIVVLEKGEVVESGSHTELINKNGRYRDFLSLQNSNH